MFQVAPICLQLLDTQLYSVAHGYLESLRVLLAIRSCLAQTDPQKLRTPRPNIRGLRAQNRWQRPAGKETYHKLVLQSVCEHGVQVCCAPLRHGRVRTTDNLQMSSADSLGRFRWSSRCF